MSASAASGGSPFRVVIAGGGIAGLEGLLALLDLARGRVEVQLVSPSDEFVVQADAGC